MLRPSLCRWPLKIIKWCAEITSHCWILVGEGSEMPRSSSEVMYFNTVCCETALIPSFGKWCISFLCHWSDIIPASKKPPEHSTVTELSVTNVFVLQAEKKSQIYSYMKLKYLFCRHKEPLSYWLFLVWQFPQYIFLSVLIDYNYLPCYNGNCCSYCWVGYFLDHYIFIIPLMIKWCV